MHPASLPACFGIDKGLHADLRVQHTRPRRVTYLWPCAFERSLHKTTYLNNIDVWTMQAAAYMVRINERTSSALHELRKTYFPNADSLSNTIAVNKKSIGTTWKHTFRYC